MMFRLRTVIYQSNVEIENVPIFSCNSCQKSEVFAEVKPELTSLIGKLGSKPDKRQLLFDEYSEIAHLMMRASDKKLLASSLESIIQERINELLDLLLIAKSLDDEAWIADVRGRLSQLAKNHISVNDFS
ncbi:hypothetical protein [Paenibacillus thalictri]|nr:hypothetical protein [Paenibacillus thalictri]